jgi:hypothetical protein
METHWPLLLAVLTTVGCGNGNAGGPPAQTTGGAESNGGTQSGAENDGGAKNAAGAENTAGAAQVGEPALADGPGSADAGFEHSPLFLTHMRQAMTGLPSSPHGIVQIFYSSNIEPILGRASFAALPTGTLALKKQDRDGDGVVDQIMVMVKRPAGTQPDYGDWTWEQRDPATFDLVTSSVTDSGFGDFCAGCHRGFPATDWLAGTALSN